MDEKICQERMSTLGEKIQTNTERLNSHSERIKEIDEKFTKITHENSATIKVVDTRLMNVVESLEQTNSTLKWIAGLIVVQLIAFFFNAVQTGIFGG